MRKFIKKVGNWTITKTTELTSFPYQATNLIGVSYDFRTYKEANEFAQRN